MRLSILESKKRGDVVKRINPTNDAETFDNSEEALDELVKAISKMYKQEDVSKKNARADPQKDSEDREN